MLEEATPIDAARPRRADAVRNHDAVLRAADELFSERGLDVGVAEIAARAGVGRGTLFRNFPCKQDLIAAVVVLRMRDGVTRGRELLQRGDPGEAVFVFVEEVASRQVGCRALFEAVGDEFLSNPEIRRAHAEIVAVLDELLEAGKRAGTVRAEIEASDVLMMLKGVCAAAWSFGGPGGEISPRHLDLVRAAIASPAHPRPLRGQPPALI